MSNLSVGFFNLVFAAMLIALVIGVAWAIRCGLGMVEKPLGMAAALALSAGGLGLAVFALAALGWIGQACKSFFPISLYWWHVPAGLWIAIAVAAAAWRGGLRQSVFHKPQLSAGTILSLIFLAWMFATDLLLCFEPQFRSDAIWYHLTLPYYWVMEHSLRAYPAWLTAATIQSQAPPTVEGYPLLTEMLYAIPVSHGGPFAARIIHLSFGLGVVAAIYGYLRAGCSGRSDEADLECGGLTPLSPARLDATASRGVQENIATAGSTFSSQSTMPSRRAAPGKAVSSHRTPNPPHHFGGCMSPAAALAVASAFFVFDSVNEVGTWANTDLARAFFMVAAAAMLARFADSGERRDLILAAVIAGLAMSTHYLAMLFSGGLLAVVYVIATVRERKWRIIADLAIFWTISLIIFFPWHLKNIVLFGRAFCGVPGRILTQPTVESLNHLLFDNSFFLGFGGVAFWLLIRGGAAPSERLLSVYLLGYLAIGAVVLPPIARFFFPVFGIGLMLAGRLVAPLFRQQRWLEIVFPAALLSLAVVFTVYQWRQHLYDASLDFLFHNTPSMESVVWHR